MPKVVLDLPSYLQHYPQRHPPFLKRNRTCANHPSVSICLDLPTSPTTRGLSLSYLKVSKVSTNPKDSTKIFSPSMCGQIESDAQSLLPLPDVVTVELIAFFDRTETGVLSNRPWSLRIHGRIWSPSIWILSRHFVSQIRNVRFRIYRFDLNTLKVVVILVNQHPFPSTVRSSLTSAVFHINVAGSLPFKAFDANLAHSGSNGSRLAAKRLTG